MPNKPAPLELLRKETRIGKSVWTKLCTAASNQEDPTKTYLAKTESDISEKLAALEVNQKKFLLDIAGTEVPSEQKDLEEGDSELDKQIEADAEYKQKILKMLSSLQAALDSFDNQRSLNSSRSNCSFNNSVMLKLPKVKISCFSDNSVNLFAFYQFKISFLNAMSSVEGITSANKLVYLKSYLKGRALTLIENFPINDEL